MAVDASQMGVAQQGGVREMPSASSHLPPGTLWAGTWAGQQTYAVHAVFSDGASGLVPCSALSWEEQTDEVACRISAEFPDETLEDGRYLSQLITLRTPITLLAALQPHLELEEVARGIIEEVEPSDGHKATFSVIAYDPSHALLTTQVDLAIPKGTTIGAAIEKLVKDWKLPMAQTPDALKSVTLSGALVFHGQTLADVLNKLLLSMPNAANADDFSTGRWVWRTTKGIIEAVQVGKNSDVYWLVERQSALAASVRIDATEVISKVVVTGVSDGDKDEAPNKVIGTYDGDQTNGTRQAILNITQHMSVEDVEKQAREMYAQKGYPRFDRSVTAPDVPMLRRYDQVRVTAGVLDGYYVVESVTHDEAKATMVLKLGNIKAQPLMGSFTLIDASAIPPLSSTGGAGGSLVDLSGPINPAQVCALAKMAGFGDESVLATAVSMAEDHAGDPSAMSPTRDIGLWQVNELWWSKFGGQQALTDPLKNAKAAKAIKDQQGWKAWSTYNAGVHRQYLDQAKAACEMNVQIPVTQAAFSGGTGFANSKLAKAIQPWLGTPYLMGGTSKKGVDCSAFTQAVYKTLGLNLPRTAQQQYDAMSHPALGSEQIGDLVFFSGTYNAGTPVTHVGIVIDPASHQMVHAGDPVHRGTYVPFSGGQLYGFGRL